MIARTLSFLLVLASAMLGALASPASADEHPDYSLRIRAKQGDANAGSEVRIEVVQTIIADHQVEVPVVSKRLDQIDLFYKTYVYDENGNLAPETKYGRRVRTGRDDPGETTIDVFSAATRYLQPGESKTDEILLNKLYDLSKPGKYTVHVEGLDSARRTAKSNTITITVASDVKGGAK